MFYWFYELFFGNSGGPEQIGSQDYESLNMIGEELHNNDYDFYLPEEEWDGEDCYDDEVDYFDQRGHDELWRDYDPYDAYIDDMDGFDFMGM